MCRKNFNLSLKILLALAMTAMKTGVEYYLYELMTFLPKIVVEISNTDAIILF
jgi:hypothetical protein